MLTRSMVTLNVKPILMQNYEWADTDLTDTGKEFMNNTITTVRLDGFDTTKLEGNEFYIH
jgi:hypothetical protein